MKNKIKKYNLKIDEGFFDFINNEVLPGTQIDKDFFWNNFSKLIYDFEPINQQLLKKRVIIQQQLDIWHRERLGSRPSPGRPSRGTSRFLDFIGSILKGIFEKYPSKLMG